MQSTFTLQAVGIAQLVACHLTAWQMLLKESLVLFITLIVFVSLF